MSDLVIRKPLGVWNADLKLDWGKLFATIAKTALKTASAKFDEALEESTGLLEAFGIAEKADKPEVLAWLLINRALGRAVHALLVEARERHPDLPFKVEGDGAAVLDVQRLLDDQITLGRDFLNRPENLEVLKRAKPLLRDWFADLGLNEAEAGALAGRLDGLFPRMMRDEWREPARDYAVLRHWVETPLDDAVARQEAWERAASEVTALPLESVFGEAFSLKDVFVPLRAYVVERTDEDEGRGARGETAAARQPTARMVWMRDALLAFVAGDDKRDTLRVISGGPGSGKSSVACMMAAELADRPDLRVLYIPLHRYRLGGLMRDEVTRYCRTWLFEFDMDPLEALETDRVLVIFFDGLDELTGRGKAAETEANEFARELRTFLNEENRRRPCVKAIVGGRELVVQSTSEARFRAAPVLHAAPFSLDEEFKDRFDWQGDAELLEMDQRDDWWRKFATATGGGDGELPDRVRNNAQLSKLTAQPLLNYLVAGFLARRGDEDASEISVNAVYRELVGHVYERRWGRPEGGPSAADLVPIVDTPEKFFTVLEEIALSVWHAGGRAVRMETVEAYLDNAELSGLVREMETTLEGGVANLLVTFFFRKQRGWRGDESVEFTHKSFQEYLCARRLHRAAEEVAEIAASERRWREALQRWTELTGPALLTPEIFEFLTGEVASDGNPARLRTLGERLCALFSEQLVNGFPMEDVKGPCGIRPAGADLVGPSEFRSMRDWAERSELALLATLNAVHRALDAGPGAAGDIRARIAVPDRFAFLAWVQRLQALEMREADREPVAGLVNKLLSQLDPAVGSWQDVSKRLDETSDNGAQTGEEARHYLGCADLSHADLFGARLYRADLYRADLSHAHLSHADLSHAHLYRADLYRADLSHAHLSHADLSHADLYRADLSHADLFGAHLYRADLYRADLSHAHLSHADLFGANLFGANLLHADLRGAERLNDARDLHDARNLEHAIFDPGVREKLGLPSAAPDDPELAQTQRPDEAED